MLGSTASKVTWVGRARTLVLCVLALLVAASIGMLVGVKPAHATEFRITLFDDAGDAIPGDGRCSTDELPEGAGGFCTLRAAIQEANADAQSDTITFSSGASGIITLTLGQLKIIHDLSIQGHGARKLTVSGNIASGVLLIDTEVNPTVNATINGIRISGGSTDFGGIYNNGTTTLTNSTVSGNTADNGGIYDNSNTTMASTIVAGNSASRTGSDVKEPDLDRIDSQGFNLIGDVSGSAGWVGSDLLNHDALLGPLHNNGGPTNTHALKPTSPAINAIPTGTNGCATDVTTDQRGVRRPQGGKCEIGSFEDASPKVTSVVSKEGATGVGRQPTAGACFSEAMKKSTITTTTLKLYKVEGATTTRVRAQVRYDATNKEGILTPSAPLEAEATYKAVVTTAVTDLAGNPLDQDGDPSDGNQPKKWSFKVRT